jgi:hypothetical protein
MEVVEGGDRGEIAHAQEGPDLVGTLGVDGGWFVPVGMVEKLYSSRRGDEHGNAVRNRDKVVTTVAGRGGRREDLGVFLREFVVVGAGGCELREVGRP